MDNTKLMEYFNPSYREILSAYKPVEVKGLIGDGEKFLLYNIPDQIAYDYKDFVDLWQEFFGDPKMRYKEVRGVSLTMIGKKRGSILFWEVLWNVDSAHTVIGISIQIPFPAYFKEIVRAILEGEAYLKKSFAGRQE